MRKFHESPRITSKAPGFRSDTLLPRLDFTDSLTKPCYTENSFSSTNSYTLGITVLLLRVQSKYLQESVSEETAINHSAIPVLTTDVNVYI